MIFYIKRIRIVMYLVMSIYNTFLSSVVVVVVVVVVVSHLGGQAP